MVWIFVWCFEGKIDWLLATNELSIVYKIGIFN
jgi:hypothetical protein